MSTSTWMVIEHSRLVRVDSWPSSSLSFRFPWLSYNFSPLPYRDAILNYQIYFSVKLKLHC